mgnify:CR=1 FL=1
MLDADWLHIFSDLPRRSTERLPHEYVMTKKPIDDMSEREFEQFLRLSGATRKQARDITIKGFRPDSSPSTDDLDDIFDDDAVTTAIAKMQRALSKGAL